MNWSWFGPKAGGYSGGPASWQGWLALAVFLAAIAAARIFLSGPAKDYATGALVIGFLALWYFTYDRDAAG